LVSQFLSSLGVSVEVDHLIAGLRPTTFRNRLPAAPDDRHPTVAGTYLAACALYRTIYHKQAIGLPAALPGLKLSSSVALTLQQVADAAWVQLAQPG